MKQLKVSQDLTLPTDTVTSTLIVYGGKGMGKTNLGSVLMEELDAADLRFAIVDPVGVWWGLRHGVDGEGRGIEVLILGGIHGDIPIEPTGGAVVADLVVDEDVNVLIDISRRPDGTMWSIGERIRFVTDYAKRLYQRQGERRRPIMQVIDEAARFIPQTVRKGEEYVAACMGAIATLVEEGRNVGIGVTLITQRSARLNKDVAELADMMIAFRTVGPNSRRAVLDWLGEHVEKERHRELGDRVRKLGVGSALVVSPGWLEYEGVVAFRARRTFDSSKTPRPGEQVRASGPGAKPDLAKYQSRMAETIDRAKADDPKELRKKLAAAEKENAALRRATGTAEAQSTPGDIAQLKRELRAEWEPLVKERDVRIREMEAVHVRLGRAVEKIQAALSDIASELGKDLPKLPALPPIDHTRHAAAAAPRPAQIRPSTPPRTSGGNGKAEGVTGAQQRILDALAWLASIGLDAPAKNVVAWMAGASPTSSGFANNMGSLRSAGLIEYPRGGAVALTEAGWMYAHAPEAPLTPEEMQRYIMAKVSTPQQRILEVLIREYPKALAKDDLATAAEASPTSSGFANNLGSLRSLGLIDYPERGHVAAQPVLFLEERR